jgi:hypothetical protein
MEEYRREDRIRLQDGVHTLKIVYRTRSSKKNHAWRYCSQERISIKNEKIFALLGKK